MAAAAVWAVLELAGAALLPGYPVFQIVALRYTVHLAILVALFGVRPGPGLARTARLPLQLGRASLMAIMPAAAAVAFPRIGAGTWTAFWAAPMAVMACGMAVQRERPIRGAASAALAGFAGALLVYPPMGLSVGIGPLAALVMGGAFALYVALTRELRAERTATNLFYSALGSLLLVAPAAARGWQPVTLKAGLGAVVVGSVGLVALWLIDRVAARAAVADTAPFLYLQIPFATLGTWWLTGSRPSHAAAAGIAVITGAMAWFTASARRSSAAR